MIIDLSAEQHDPPAFNPRHTFPHHKIRGGKVVKRDPKTITGITIHQTGCVFGPVGDPVAKHRRALLDVAAHCTAFRDGTAVIGNPLLWYVNHGNGLNAFTLGLECEGIYRGTMLHGAHEISDIAIASFREGLKELVTRGRAMGMPIQFIYAHRQSHPTKVGDPGAEIWQRVVLEYGAPILGLQTQNDHTWGQGHPIPGAWDPSATAHY